MTHDICHATARAQAARFSADLRQARIDAGVDAEIGVAIRAMCQPGQKRKTVRVDELRALVTDVQARWARQIDGVS